MLFDIDIDGPQNARFLQRCKRNEMVGPLESTPLPPVALRFGSLESQAVADANPALDCYWRPSENALF